MNKRIFLHGGHDLEMLEIKRVLMSHGEHFVDANLDFSFFFFGRFRKSMYLCQAKTKTRNDWRKT